jgi:predicted nucleotidyltransferase
VTVLPTGLPDRLAAWCRERQIRLCLLYGSRATGKARPDSDWDLAIWAPPTPPLERLAWYNEVANLFDQEVQILFVSRDTDPVLGMELVRHGRVLFEAEPHLWANERLRLWHVFNDHLPLLQAEREQMRRRAEASRRGA